MDEKQTRLLTWLSAILLAVVAFLVFVKPPEEKKEGEVAWEKLTPDLKSADATGLVIARGDGTLRFERSGSTWTVRQGDGPPYAADARKVSAVIDAVLGAEATGGLGAADPGAFGLNPPYATISVLLPNDVTAGLVVGHDTPVGWGTYVQKEAGGEVLRVNTKLSGSVNAGGAGGINDFRDKAILPGDLGEVTGLSLSSAGTCAEAPCPDQTLSLQRDAHGWWLVDGERRLRADEDKVQGVIDGLLELKAEGFTTDAFPEPAAATVTLTRDGKPPVTLRFAAALDARRMLQSPLFPDAAVVEDTLSAVLARGAADWADTRLVPLRSGTLTKLTLRLGDQKLEATRGAEGWTPGGAETALADLAAVRVDRVQAAPAPAGAPAGDLVLESPTVTERLSFTEQDGVWVAVDAAGGLPFVVPATEIQRLRDAITHGNSPTPAPSAAGPSGAPTGGPEGMPSDLDIQKLIEQMGQQGG